MLSRELLELDDRRDEPECPPPEEGWRPPKRRPWQRTGLHANPAEFPPDDEKED